MLKFESRNFFIKIPLRNREKFVFALGFEFHSFYNKAC